MSTVRVRPPRKGAKTPRNGKAKGKTGPQEVQSWLFRYRYQLWPYWVMLVVLITALIVNDPVILAGAYFVPCTALLAGVLLTGKGGGDQLAQVSRRAFTAWRLPRPAQQRYATTVFWVAGSWSVWAIGKGGYQPFLVLPFLTTVLAMPWFKRGTRETTIPVTIAPELSRADKSRAQDRAGKILNGWDVITRHGRIPFAQLEGMTFGEHSLIVDVQLRGGQAARSLSYPTIRTSLESAFDMDAGSLRVEQQPESKKTRKVRLRFITKDPNVRGLGAAPEDVTTMGRFETGDPVEFDDGPHTVVCGQTGYGKSVLVNQIVRRKVRLQHWAVIAIDLKPGALELGPWRRVLAYLADTPDRVLFALQALIDGMEARGGIMEERGWRDWTDHASPVEPNICLVVDEAQELRQIKGAMALLTRLAALSRAYGFQLVIATQFPKDENLPSEIMAQISQIFACRLKAPKDDRVVFGENATAEGWTPSAIPMGEESRGVYYVQSGRYTVPSRARGWWMSVDQVKAEAAQGHRTLLDASTAIRWIQAGQHDAVGVSATSAASEDRAALYGRDDVVDAVVVSETPEGTILEAIRSGHGTTDALVEATGIPRSTVTSILHTLFDEGKIMRHGKRATKSNPWMTVD